MPTDLEHQSNPCTSNLSPGENRRENHTNTKYRWSLTIFFYYEYLSDFNENLRILLKLFQVSPEFFRNFSLIFRGIFSLLKLGRFYAMLKTIWCLLIWMILLSCDIRATESYNEWNMDVKLENADPRQSFTCQSR